MRRLIDSPYCSRIRGVVSTATSGETGDSSAMPKIDITAVPVQKGSGYPSPFDSPCATRIRRRLGDTAGLRDFGVNLMTLPPGAWTSQRHWHSHELEIGSRHPDDLTTCSDIDLRSANSDGRFVRKEGSLMSPQDMSISGDRHDDTNVPLFLRGGVLPGVIAGLIFGALAFSMTGDLSRGLTFLVGGGFAFACGPRITNAFRAFWRKPDSPSGSTGKGHSDD